jgi:multidrug efflux pump subunit AcrB
VNGEAHKGSPDTRHGFTNAVVHIFLHSHLSLILILLAAGLGLTALLVTPREEDPQIVVPLADVYVRFPGHSAAEVEQLVATPLEKLLFEIDGVEYVYSMSRDEEAIITVRFFVGQDRERSLVKLYKRIDEHLDVVPPGVSGWVVKPVEIDDVPIVTLTLRGQAADAHEIRRVGEELAHRLSEIENLSRSYVVGGLRRVVQVYLDPDRLQAYGLSPAAVRRAIEETNVAAVVGRFDRGDAGHQVRADHAIGAATEMPELVVGVRGEQPVFLKDVASVMDGAEEAGCYVRHGWGAAAGFEEEGAGAGSRIWGTEPGSAAGTSQSAVTIALAKKKGSNAVRVADEVIGSARKLAAQILPDGVEMVITRNYGTSANDKVNELVEALAVAVFIVIALLTLGMGWRESLIVALAVPVVFGLTLTVNMLFGFTINRVTLFALILSLGLLVDDPIVDVENISRHFALRGRASRAIVLEAVAEIRPPLITATLAVIVSFLPMAFITGMMGPYMRPMALNVPVAMLMSMVVAFTITPWLTYHMLKRRYAGGGEEAAGPAEDADRLKESRLYRFFYPLMAPLLRSRKAAWSFLAVMGVLTVLAGGLAMTRRVPLKMLPFDNKNELLLVLDMDEGTTLERTDAVVRDMEAYLGGVAEVTDYTSYVGTASPMDFNGMVRHYYLRKGANQAEIRVNLVGKKSRSEQSHAIGLRERDGLSQVAARHGGQLKIVETPPGPPVLSSVVAEVYGRPDHAYEDLIEASAVVKARLAAEPGVVEVDDSVESQWRELVFVPDAEKAALHGISAHDIAETLKLCLEGAVAGLVHEPRERQPLEIALRLPRAARSSGHHLGQIRVQGTQGSLVALAEVGAWRSATVNQTIYHKNLKRVVYVFAEMAGRPPADVVMDVQADRVSAGDGNGSVHGWTGKGEPKPVEGRTFLANGGGLEWSLPKGLDVAFTGEGEWQITLDVFRDLGLAFGAALAGIYILLVAQTGSFMVPVVVMLAIPLSILGIMPGFWLLNAFAAGTVGGYADPIFFTATGMIGMIALAGIVTRDAIILVDFIHLSQARGRSLFDAIMESRVVRLRPILLTAGTALLSAAPIAIDPIFSGLAWALIFGLLVSSLFTLVLVPMVYAMIYGRRHA